MTDAEGSGPLLSSTVSSAGRSGWMAEGLMADSCVLMAYSVSALTTLNLHMNRIKRRVKTHLFLVALMLVLAACGQRGNLYLPKPEQAPAKTQESAANETKANKTENDETENDETGDDKTGEDRDKTL
jgi:predicted small lipoprotein YifL